MLNLAGYKQAKIKGITPFGHIRFLYDLAAASSLCRRTVI